MTNNDNEEGYFSEEQRFKFVTLRNKFMKAAKEYAMTYSLDKGQPTGSVIVKNGIILGKGANGSDYHNTHECDRKRLGIPTGQQYELCEGCHPKNHSEPRALLDAQRQGHDTESADVYLWGHFWCCRWCWGEMMKAGIKNIYLLKGSEKIFNRPRTK